MSRRSRKAKKAKSKLYKKYKKSYKGGAGKCAAEKPVCIKINKFRQKMNCASNEANLLAMSDPIYELQHAYEVEINKKLEEKRDDNTCIDSDRSNCFCTNFDFVWLTNISEAKKRLNGILIKQQFLYYQKNSMPN
jgi:hypothetical protein